MTINEKVIIKKYDVYLGKTGKHFFIFHPLLIDNLYILNREAMQIFELIDNKSTPAQIYQKTLQIDPTFTKDNLNMVLSDLLDNKLIYQKRQPIKKPPMSKSKTLGIWLHVTNQCNFRCRYCYLAKTPERMSEKTSEQALYKIYQAAKDNNFDHVKIKISGGEALMEFPHVLKIIDMSKNMAEKNKIDTSWVILSNGSLLTDEIAAKIKDSGASLMISLDGLKEYNDKVRVMPNGSGTFEYIKRGIDLAKKHQIVFNVSVTITESNSDNLPELISYLLKESIPFSLNFFRENCYSENQLRNSDSKLITNMKKVYRIIYRNPPKVDFIDGMLDRVSTAKPHYKTCAVGDSYIVIDQRGNLAGCQMKIEDVLGSLNDADIYQTMKKNCFFKPRDLTVEKKEGCHKCFWRYVCCGGCPLLTYQYYGRYDTKSPLCNVYRTLIPEILKIRAKHMILQQKIG